MTKLVALTTALLLVAACGKKDDAAAGSGRPAGDKPADRPAGDQARVDLDKPLPPTPTPATPAAPPADDRCEITVEGDLTAKGESPGGPMAVGSDYWMSDAEIKEAVKAMAGALGGGKPVDLDAELKKDPRIYTLLINCATPRAKISIGPSMGSKYADVPFGPKKYKIAAPKGEQPGLMTTLTTFEGDTGVWVVDGEGELDVSKFDKTGIAGSFSYGLAEATFGDKSKTPRKVKVTGKFAFKCSFNTSVCQGSAGAGK